MIKTWVDLTNHENFQDVCQNGYLYAYYTDKLLFQKTEEVSFENLLELRLFNTAGELRLLRTNIYEEFTDRFIDETGKKEGIDYFVQNQYLDIDSSKAHIDGMVYTTGGGQYPLPIELRKKYAYITIHNYVKYYEKTGQAYVYDWRLVSIQEGVIKYAG